MAADGSLRRQVIRSHGIDKVGQMCSCHPLERISITCAISVLRNDRKWKYFKAADDDAGNLQPVFLKRLYLLHICIFSFFLFNTSLTTI